MARGNLSPRFYLDAQVTRRAAGEGRREGTSGGIQRPENDIETSADEVGFGGMAVPGVAVANERPPNSSTTTAGVGIEVKRQGVLAIEQRVAIRVGRRPW